MIFSVEYLFHCFHPILKGDNVSFNRNNTNLIALKHKNV